jgi:hypothetical protein
MTTRVLTANIQKDVSEETAGHALDRALVGADLAALQEFKHDRDALLEDMPGWVFKRGRGGGPPVGVRRSWGKLLKARRIVLAGSRRVIPVPGRKSVLPDTLATLAVTRMSGEWRKTSLISIHLPAHVEHWPGPRRTMHTEAVKRLTRVIRRQRLLGRRVFVAGDTNWDEFELPPLVSCWHGRKPVGTLGGRTVDIVYADLAASEVRTLNVGSDHRAVIATYTEETR